MVSGNQKEFVGSDPRRSWQDVAGDKPVGSDKMVKSYEA